MLPIRISEIGIFSIVIAAGMGRRQGLTAVVPCNHPSIARTRPEVILQVPDFGWNTPPTRAGQADFGRILVVKTPKDL